MTLCARTNCKRTGVTIPGQHLALCLAHHESAGKSKYGNKRSYSEAAARSFDSAWEREFCEGKLAEARAGQITGLEFQKTFKLEVNGVLVATYRADAVWFELDGRYIVADCKGFLTPIYKLKARLLKACLGITVFEVYKPRRKRA